MEQRLELLKKLKALSERGIGGEKTNADRLLTKLLKESGLTLADLDAIERKPRLFSLNRQKMKIFVQIVRMILGSGVSIMGNRQRTQIQIDCNASEYIEIQAMFNFYWSEYQRDLKTFELAFIHTNNLHPSDTPKDGDLKLTEKEEAEREKVLLMMFGMEKKSYHKQLERSIR